MQSTARKTFREGSVRLTVHRFEEEPRLGFTLWRPSHRAGSPSGTTQTFDHTHLNAISVVLGYVAAVASLPDAEAEQQAVLFERRPLLNEDLLHSYIVDEVVLTIHASSRAPWLMLRRIVVGHPATTENWFFMEHVPSLQSALAEAAVWFRRHQRAAS